MLKYINKRISPRGRRDRWVIGNLCLLLMFASFASATAQTAGQKLELPAEVRERVERLLAKSPAEAKTEIETLSGPEAAALITQILSVKDSTNPDLRTLYPLIKQAEAIRADAQSAKRLRNLLLVLGLTLGLFSLFLIYVVLDQRRSLERLRELGGLVPSGESGASDRDVYRGE